MFRPVLEHRNRIMKLANFARVAGVALAVAGLATSPALASPNLDLARQLNQAFVEVADKVSPAVVVITVTQKKTAAAALDENEDLPDFLPREFYKQYRKQLEEEPLTGQGSGVIIRKDGFILTNRHVVEDAEKVEVRLKDGRTFTATVRGVDPQSDVAVIKIDAKDLPIATFADSAKTRVGEFAIAIGAPFQLDYSVTFGHVSAKSRSNVVPMMVGGGMMDQDFIQTDANINPGNSGGPLVNIEGEIIGINTLIRGLRTGIGFAIPSNLAREVSDGLIADGKFTRAWLGVSIFGLKESPEFQEMVKGVSDGVVVRAILPDGPAKKSALRSGDVILTVDGKPVTTPQELRNEVRSKKIGTAMTLEVFRPQDEGEGKRMTVKLDAAERIEKPIEIAAVVEKKPAPEETNSLGFSVKPLTRELAKDLGAQASAGVVVATVDQDSLAALHGIKPGDVITAINHKSVSSVRQFKQTVKSIDLKKGVFLHLVSGDTARFEVLKEAGK